MRCTSTAALLAAGNQSLPPERDTHAHALPAGALGVRVCRVTLPHEPPYTLSKDRDDRGREVDALLALVARLRTQPPDEWPDALLLLGDQIYAARSPPRPSASSTNAAAAATRARPAAGGRRRLQGVHPALSRGLERSRDALAAVHRL
jgi:hypothetical protein